MDFDMIRDRLVLAALPHVVFDGWTMTALEHAARDEGLDPTLAERAFLAGPVAAVEHFIALADAQMMADVDAEALTALKVPDRIEFIMLARFNRWAPHREAVRRALAVLALRPVAAAQATARTADAIWHLAGDTSHDFSWYTRRATLAAVYGATLLVWLDDESEDAAVTRAFLRRRLGDVGRLTATRKRLEGWLRQARPLIRPVLRR